MGTLHMEAAEQQAPAEKVGGLTKITKEWLKPHSPCSDGYRWFLEKFPRGADFGEVYALLRADRRYDDADWLASAAFKSLDTAGITTHTVAMAGADAAKIEAQVQADGATPDATATTGEHAVAAALGIDAKAKAAAGGAIALVCRDSFGKLLAIRASKVGENGIKPDTLYSLSAEGEFVEVSE